MGAGTAWKVTVSFIAGALCSAIAGYIGMFVSIRANIRTAAAAMTSLNSALQIALRGGAVSGLSVVSMSLLGVGGLFWLFGGMSDYEHVPLQIVGFGFGASFVALFAQLGGGIYTKAADVGADLVGKVEAGIPEDDPRNPAVIADLVGDNVGDCAGRGADLFESTAAENVGAMILGHRALSRSFGMGGHPVPAAGARLRSDRHRSSACCTREVPRGRGPDERPQPRLPDHDRPGDDRLRRGVYLLLQPVAGATVPVAPGLPARRRRHRHPDGVRLRLDHAVLHRVQVPPGARRSPRPARPARPPTSSAASRSASSAPACR